MSWDAEKAFDKIQCSFIKTLNKIGTEEMYLYIIKVIYDKCTSNIILNGKRLKFFLSKIRKKTKVPILTTAIQHSTRCPCQSNQERKNKRHQNWKVKSKTVSICRWHDYMWKSWILRQRTVRFNQWIQYTCRTQNENAKINSISIYL